MTVNVYVFHILDFCTFIDICTLSYFVLQLLHIKFPQDEPQPESLWAEMCSAAPVTTPISDVTETWSTPVHQCSEERSLKLDEGVDGHFKR